MWFLILVGIILGLGVIISLIMAIPVDAVLDLDVHGKPVFNARIEWFFGRVTFNPTEKKTGEKAARPEKPSQREKKPRPKRSVPGEGWERFGSVLEILYTPGLFDEIKKLFIRLFRAFEVHKLAGKFFAGLSDPAITGMAYGLYEAVTVPFGGWVFRNVQLYPVFDGFVFEGDLHAVIRVRPILLVAPVVLFVTSWPVLKVIRTLIATEWKIRKYRQSAAYPSAA